MLSETTLIPVSLTYKDWKTLLLAITNPDADKLNVCLNVQGQIAEHEMETYGIDMAWDKVYWTGIRWKDMGLKSKKVRTVQDSVVFDILNGENVDE